MLAGQVERRLKASILTVANMWYTAWVDAGQPNLKDLVKDKKQTIPSDEEMQQIIAEEQRLLNENRMIGRDEK
jgi:hypothetical protein